MYILGISAFYHDSAACLFRNSTLVGAAEEERFTGIKGDMSFPNNTINWLLKSNGIKIDDIKTICWYENPKLKRERVIENFKRNPIPNLSRIFKFIISKDPQYNLKKFLKKEIGFSGNLQIVDHHLSHASLSYFTSYFEESNILTVDGVGEKETITISKAKGNKIEKIHSVEYPNSLGLFYSALTAFIGFKPNEGEYKLMGLAAYGNPDIFYEKLKDLISFSNGKLSVNMKYFSWHKSDTIMFNQELCSHLNMNPRLDEAINSSHQDLAAAVQKIYEEIFLDFVRFSYSLNPSDNICLGGGCSYNGLANGKIISNSNYKKVWVPLSPSDGGSSIGSCLYYINVIKRQKKKSQITPYLGPDFSESQLFISTLEFKDKIECEKFDTGILIDKVSDLLAEGKVIGWFQGKMEFGARALGNRSIIASPLIDEMQDKINLVIKKRELFRPFAPSVVLDQASKFFNIDAPVPYMNTIVKVNPEWNLPAITHIDGTARVQTVTSFENPRYYHLLKKFGEKTGFPILLNTSFNFKDQTITLYPKDAIIRFLDSEMDYLVLGNFIISKNPKCD
jgi:carbamoyltransferase